MNDALKSLPRKLTLMPGNPGLLGAIPKAEGVYFSIIFQKRQGYDSLLI